ncbi:MAG: OsmC family protein [Zoogloeaceae bacterium]|nr:OsmC family protein [Zoogloeaceae bacterium]MCP5239280.1 OsmC family protein [Zoogloeaceae bacterium]MCP5255867.1 OsmC family protein [Zoogloeaceae bacterium]
MNGDELRATQAPLKAQYRDTPEAAQITLQAEGRLGEGVTCSVGTGKALVVAGLHPATGGSGLAACSGDMLLEALVACAGVTLNAVATALGIALRDATLSAEGDLDFRGTLGLDREVPVGFRAIRLAVTLDTDAPQEQIDTLLRLTERYCVVFQTLAHPPSLSVALAGPASG